jgi:Transposase DDE domain group 1
MPSSVPLFHLDFYEPLPIQIKVSDPPLTFDLDAVDDPTHGSQQLTLFHAFYEQYQYLPLVITCADNDQVVMVSLRHGTATAS